MKRRRLRASASNAPSRDGGLLAGAFVDAPVGLALVDAEGRVVAVNRALEAFLGLDAEEIIGHGLGEYVAADERGDLRRCLASLERGTALRYDAERRYVHASGALRTAQESGAATSVDGAGRMRAVVQVQDVTGRREAAASLSERDARLRFVLEQLPAVVWTTDANLVFTSILGRRQDLAHLLPGQGVGMSLAQRFQTQPPCAFAVTAHQRALAGESVSFEIVADGRTFRTRVEPLRGPSEDAVVGTIGVASDVTELHDIEGALRSSESQFRTLAETMTAAAFIFQGNRLVYANRAAEQVSGYSFDELKQRPFWDIARADYREIMQQRGLARQRGEPIPSRYEVCIVTKGGQERWVDFTGSTTEYRGAPAVLGTAFDVTERKRAEAAVRESEERLRAIFDKSPLGMALLDPEQRLIDANAALCRMVGYTREEIVEMTLDTASHPAEAFLNSLDLRRLVEGVPVMQRERRIIRRNGETGWFRLTASIVNDAAGVSLYHLIMVEDITEQRLSEQAARRHRAELGRVLRLRSMGELAAGLAHELNQPLSAVVGFAKGCVKRLETGDLSPAEIVGKLDQIAEEALRAGSIIKWVQRFLRNEQALRQPTDVAALLSNIARLVEQEARQRNVEIRVVVEPGLPLIALEVVQVEQVVFNLVRNAFDAIAEKEGENADASPDTIEIAAAVDERALVVTVRDSGPGLSLGDPERIFEPFYSSKGPEGMGLGLSISRSIVESHGGTLRVLASSDAGTTFRMVLPVDRT